MNDVLLPGLSFSANESVRATSAEALPSMVKAAKKRGSDQDQILAMARLYIQSLFKVIEEEDDTEAKIAQTDALKLIIDEVGSGLFSAEEVGQLGTTAIKQIELSNGRIKEKDDEVQAEVEDEDDALDITQKAHLKIETSYEHKLQVSCAQILGSLFKTHKDHVANLVDLCKTDLIPSAMASKVHKRYRLVICLLVDMIEHLGPDYFSPEDLQVIINTICSFCDHPSAANRQASSFGIGLIAKHGGESFHDYSQLCLNSLKKAIDVTETEKVKKDDGKLADFNFARDNAISSIGKILKYQNAFIR